MKSSLEREELAGSRGDTTTKGILESERVCGLHFVSGFAAPVWDKYNVDWVPTLNLGKKEFGKTSDYNQTAERAERAKERRKRSLKPSRKECSSNKLVYPSMKLILHQTQILLWILLVLKPPRSLVFLLLRKTRTKRERRH